LVSYKSTAKISLCENSNYDLMNIKDFQGPIASNSKTLKALYSFPGLSRSWKTGKNFQGLSRRCGHPAVWAAMLLTAKRV